MSSTLYPVIESIEEEYEFLRLLCSFQHISKDDKLYEQYNISKKLYIINKLIIVCNVLFIILIIMDAVLTNYIYSSQGNILPLYTLSVSASYQWSFLDDSNLLIVYILFVLAMCCGCCYCISCIYDIVVCVELDDSYYSSNVNEVCNVCAYCCCCGPLILLLFLAVCIGLFCLSPPLLLYMLYIWFLLTNNGKVTLYQRRSYGSRVNIQILSHVDEINRCLHTISSGYHDNGLGLIHLRLSQYLIAYILWPSDDIEYILIQQKLLDKINDILVMSVDTAMQKCGAVSSDKYVFDEFIDSTSNIVNEQIATRSISNIFANIDTFRMKFYGTICILLYIIIIASFWICYYVVLQDTNQNVILFLFYVSSYCAYILLLYLLIWFSWLQFKYYLIAKYEWLLYIGYNKYNGQCFAGESKYKFVENKFVRFYCVLSHQYITYQCLKMLFDQQTELMQPWMLHMILPYLMDDNMERFIDVVYADKKCETYDEDDMYYWFDPLDELPENTDINILNCVRKQNQAFIKFLKHF